MIFFVPLLANKKEGKDKKKNKKSIINYNIHGSIITQVIISQEMKKYERKMINIKFIL